MSHQNSTIQLGSLMASMVTNSLSETPKHQSAPTPCLKQNGCLKVLTLWFLGFNHMPLAIPFQVSGPEEDAETSVGDAQPRLPVGIPVSISARSSQLPVSISARSSRLPVSISARNTQTLTHNAMTSMPSWNPSQSCVVGFGFD